MPLTCYLLYIKKLDGGANMAQIQHQELPIVGPMEPLGHVDS